MQPAAAQSPVIIKFSHVVAPDTPKGNAAEKFKELADKYTNGKAKIEVYANSSLYKDKEEVEALQLGAVQMLAPSLAKFGPLGVREFEVFDLPYIMPNKEALRKITEGPLGKKLMAKLEPKGITGLAYWDNGFKIMSANRPLHAPEDFRGLKMRIQSSKVLEAQIRALGAIPQVMAFSDVYSIKGEKKDEKEEKKKDYYLSERRYGSFQRSFGVPDGVDAEKIEAHFKDGVLTVTLPKTPQAQKSEKKIDIKKA